MNVDLLGLGRRLVHAIMASPEQLSGPIRDPFPWASVTRHWWVLLGLLLIGLALCHLADREAGS